MQSCCISQFYFQANRKHSSLCVQKCSTPFSQQTCMHHLQTTLNAFFVQVPHNGELVDAMLYNTSAMTKFNTFAMIKFDFFNFHTALSYSLPIKWLVTNIQTNITTKRFPHEETVPKGANSQHAYYC